MDGRLVDLPSGLMKEQEMEDGCPEFVGITSLPRGRRRRRLKAQLLWTMKDFFRPRPTMEKWEGRMDGGG